MRFQTAHALSLRKSEANYRVLVEGSLQGIVVVLGFPPHAVFANPAMARITGYSIEELLSLSMGSLIHPDDRASFFDRSRDRLEGKPASSPFEYRLIRKDGKVCWVEVFSSQIEYNGKSALQATIIDITKRKKAEQIGLTEKTFSESVLSSLPGIFYMFDNTGKMLRWNRNFESVSGYSSDEIARMSFLDFFVGEEKELAQEKIQEALEKGASSVEAKFVSKDGHQTPLLLTGLLFRSENSPCLIGMGIDITQRKKAERELLIKDNAISSSIDGLTISDLQGNVTYANPAFVKMLGYSSDKEVLGKPIAEMARKSKEKADEILKALKTKGWWTGEITTTRKDGSKFYSMLSGSLVKDEAGKPICMLGSFVDVTDRKKEEEALKDSEERLRQLIEYAPDAIYTNDLQGNFLEGNKQAEALTGYKKEELAGKNILKAGILPEKYAPKVMQDLMKNMQGQRTGPDEYELIRKDGTSVTAEISTFPVKREGKIEVIGIARDTTERKQADKKLKESEEKLRNTIESSPDAITITDLSGTVVDCNQASVSLNGFSSKEELIGKNSSILIAKKDHQRALENYKITAKKGFLRNVPYTLIKKDGHEYPAELSASVLKDTSGNPVGFVSVVRDVTERKQMQEKLEEYSQQLEKMVEHRTKQLEDAQNQLVKAERLAAIGQVAAMVGHDLRNPLTGINGAAYYLKMKLGPNAEKKMLEMLSLIEKDIQYSNKIITDLMEYSREIKLELTETTPKSMVAESVSLVQVPEKIQLIDLTQNEPRIKIDVDRMKRVFSNFIKNAFEAMPQGGKFTISSRALDGDVEFKFIDSGVGITKEVLERLWAPFFTTKAKGMGLGLAICKRIIEAHQGRISVESIVGEGATFTITIPIEPKPRAEGGEKAWVNMPESLLSTTTKA
jgi:PAS domain S-box-containing protein